MTETSVNKGSQRGRRIPSPSAHPPAQRLYDLKMAAEYLGRPVYSLRVLIWNGELPVIRSGRKIYLDVFDLDGWIEKSKETYV